MRGQERDRPGRRRACRPQSSIACDEPVIHFDNVSKLYPSQSRPALENVNIDVEKGEFVFLIGPSGSGKSTFLRLILREERPTGGRIHVAGKDLARLTNWKVPHLRRKIGCVFQDFRLLPNKNVFQNVGFALEVIGKPRRFIRKVVPEVIDPGTSSGIMKVLDRINRTGTTVVMATHDAAIVDSMRKRVIELEHGKVVRDQSRGVYGQAY